MSTVQTVKLTDKAVSFNAGSARANWYTAVKRYEGKAPEEFADGATKNPPAVKKDAKAEHPAGWLQYFVKERMVHLVAQRAADVPTAGGPPAPNKKMKGEK